MIHRPLEQETLELVDRWRPKRAYRHEHRFQDDLQQYLEEYFTEQGRMVTVSKERGTSARADLLVDDQIAIELKNRFSNDQVRKLRDQIRDYVREAEYVIVVACGIQNRDGWNRVQQEFSSPSGFATAPVRFVEIPLEEAQSRRSTGPSKKMSQRSPKAGSTSEPQIDINEIAAIIEEGVLGFRELLTDAKTPLTKGEAVVAVFKLGVVVIVFGFVGLLIAQTVLT